MKYLSWLILIFAIGFGLNFVFSFVPSTRYSSSYGENEAGIFNIKNKPAHLKTPKSVKAIYITSFSAGWPEKMEELIKFINGSEINSVVVDIKDYSGRIAFEMKDPIVKISGAAEKRIPDIEKLVKELHSNNIYTIGRIVVFQDPYLARIKPYLAVKNKKGDVWVDNKGLAWLEPGNKETWDYIVRIAKEAERVGFDEINFDYVRFPSDGNMDNIAYLLDGNKTRADVIEEFFKYLRSNLSSLGIALSVDLFGMTATQKFDLNIGQILERAAPYFDYISPMVYPSHYPAGYNGFKNPAEHPYEIINQAMNIASQRLIDASSTPSKLRPWIQDFDLGAVYDAPMIRKQKQAIYDAGLNSWMAWDPANEYTKEAYLNY